MHQAQAYIDSSVLPANPGKKIEELALNGRLAGDIDRRLKSDSLGYAYSGVVSIADAMRGLNANYLTWATVKLYYATFYLARSILAMKGICIFYDGHTPFRWLATAGEMPKKLRGTTHNVVLQEFRVQAPFPILLSQQIDGIGPLEWLRERREDANYGAARFDEPSVPVHWRKICDAGMRRAVETYLEDDTLLYAYDGEHAILAYPLELLKRVIAEINTLGANYVLTPQERTFLCGLYTDQQGRIPAVDRLIRA